MSEAELLGQDIAVRIVKGSTLFSELRLTNSFNETVKTEIKESGHLGEKVNRFQEILNGYGGDFEANVNRAAWVQWQEAVIARATRQDPDAVFVIVRLDTYGDGSTNLFTYEEIAWGEMPTSIGSRGDFVKVKGSFSCSKRTVSQDAVI